MNSIMKFLREEDGATAIEYGLIAGLVAVAIIGVLGTLGNNLQSLFSDVAARLNITVPAVGAGTE